MSIQICAQCGSILQQIGQIVFCDICNYQENQGQAVLEYNENLQLRSQIKQKKHVKSSTLRSQNMQYINYVQMIAYTQSRMKHVLDVLKNMQLLEDQQYQICNELTREFIEFMQQFNEQNFEQQFVYILRVYGFDLLSYYNDAQGVSNQRIGNIIVYYILTIVGVFIPPRLIFNNTFGLRDQDGKGIQILFQSKLFKETILQQQKFYNTYNNFLQLHLHYIQILQSETLGVHQLKLINEDLVLKYINKYYQCLHQIVFYHNYGQNDTHFIPYAVISNLICLISLIIQFEGVNVYQFSLVEDTLQEIEQVGQHSVDIMQFFQDKKASTWLTDQQKTYPSQYYMGLDQWLVELDEGQLQQDEQIPETQQIQQCYYFAKFPDQVEDYGLFQKIANAMDISYKYLLSHCCRDILLRINATFNVGSQQ